MRFIRNALVVIGLVSLIAVGYAIFAFEPYLSQARSLDSQAPKVYAQIARTVLETGDAAEAMVYKRQVDEGLSVEEVEDVLRLVANELNIRNVGELPMGEEVRSVTGEDFPFLKIYMFCDVAIAAQMVGHSPAMAAYLPCRIVLQEDADGNLWLMTLDLDPMIHGGRPLPEELHEQAVFVKESLEEIIDRAAVGAF
ncbi:MULTISPECIES: DUF302 domain-containing protein [unclassified Thioalkalivibrio]|uniref:DUF302 domain-containing protein n=1 Tax=unclassified Thioalkalivibrio TaxID=2621013 RepID=UPI00036862CD|nr:MULTISPECIES: DUF302 domain-containing protein [unclassified Thioalkalivibrio]